MDTSYRQQSCKTKTFGVRKIDGMNTTIVFNKPEYLILMQANVIKKMSNLTRQA